MSNSSSGMSSGPLNVFELDDMVEWQKPRIDDQYLVPFTVPGPLPFKKCLERDCPWHKTRLLDVLGNENAFGSRPVIDLHRWRTSSVLNLYSGL